MKKIIAKTDEYYSDRKNKTISHHLIGTDF
jgi:hypothetical protein